MEKIEALAAEKRFDEILDRVGCGEVIGITREGQHVATFLPPPTDPDRVALAIARIEERRELIIREGRGLSVAEILELKKEGQK